MQNNVDFTKVSALCYCLSIRVKCPFLARFSLPSYFSKNDVNKGELTMKSISRLPLKRKSDAGKSRFFWWVFFLALFSFNSEKLGASGSGKSTFVKQMRIIHGYVYSEEERRQYIPPICRNVFAIMHSLIDAMEKLRISYGDEYAAV